jgi:hypothetical protein
MKFYAENSLLVFFILTVLIGGGAAWVSGRALAMAWRPAWQILFYMALLGLVVRFFHYSLFEGTLLSLHYYLVDTAVLIIAATLAYRITRTSQMVVQYKWLYERTSPVTWRERRETENRLLDLGRE